MNLMTLPEEELFKEFSVEFERAKIPFLLIGGYAVNAYGYSRTTQDVDFMIVSSDFDKAKQILQRCGYRQYVQKDLCARFVDHEREWPPLDLVFVEQETFQNILKEARGVEVLGRKLFVPSAEHLIALKLHAVKNDPKREAKDLNDIFELIKAQGLDVGSTKFKNFCLKFGNADLFERIKKWAGTQI